MNIIDFKEITNADKPVFDRFFHARYYENSHFNFTNFYMWRIPYNIKWCEADGVLYLTAEWQGKFMALQPFGPDEKLHAAIGEILSFCERENKSFYMNGIEKNFAAVLENYEGAEFEITEDRNNFDYVYLAENLIKLAGRKYHSKKNHLNAFRKNYPDAEYLPITEDIITLCKLELNNWYKQRIADEADDPFIAHERAAIIEVLNNFTDFGLKGGAIKLDERIIAFTFGEQLNDDTAVIHVEKADPDLRGAYPAINQGFVEKEWADMTYINREEDMGIEGLRKAKESYKPIKLIEKFNVTMKQRP